MFLQSSRQTEAEVMDLCSEDDYGSWELWWHLSAGVPGGEIPALKQRLLNIIGDLVAVGKLIPKCHNTDGGCVVTGYDREKLSQELDSSDDRDPDFYFWFGTS